MQLSANNGNAVCGGLITDHSALTDDRVTVDDGILHGSTRLNARIVHNDRVAYNGTRRDIHALREYRVLHLAVDLTALCDHRACDGCLRADELRRSCIRAREDAPIAIVKIEKRLFAKQLHVRFPKACDRSDVLPIAREAVCIHRATVRKHLRNDVLTKVLGGIRIRLVLCQIFAKQLGIEYVDTHGSLGRFWLLRLFFKLENTVIFIRIHDTEAAGFLQRDLKHGDRAVRLHFLVIIEHCGIVHLVNMVTGKDQDIVRIIALDKVQILIDGICRTRIPVRTPLLLVGREHLDAAACAVKVPRLTRADILIEHKRLILRKHTYGVEPRVCTVGKRKVDDAVLTAKRNGRLGRFLRQCVKTAALTAGKQHGNALFFLIHMQNLLK